MANSFKNQNLEVLILKYKDGSITGEELEELNNILKDSAGARESYLDTVHQSLHVESVFNEIQDGELQIIGKSPDGNGGHKARRAKLFVLPVSIAAIFIISISFIQFFYSGNPKGLMGHGQVVGKIEKQVGSFVLVGEDGTFYNLSDTGNSIVPGTLKSSSHEGYIKLQLNNGAELEFVGKGALGIFKKEALNLVLHYGVLNAKIPELPSEKPLYIHTSQTELKSTKGDFLFSTYNGESLIQVRKGSAELLRRDTNEQLNLNPGGKVAVSPFRSLADCQLKNIQFSNKFDLEGTDTPVTPDLKLNISKNSHHKILGSGPFFDPNKTNSSFFGVTAKTEVVDWPSKNARYVDLVHLNIPLLSDASVHVDLNSEFVFKGVGMDTEWVEVVLHCRSLNSQDIKIFKTRHDLPSHMKSGSTGKPIKWYIPLKLDGFTDGSGEKMQQNQSYELIHAVIYTSKSRKRFIIENFHISPSRELKHRK